MTLTVRTAAALAAAVCLVLIGACDEDQPEVIDPSVAALSVANRTIVDFDLHTESIPAGRPLRIYAMDEAALLATFRGEAPFTAELATSGITAGGATTRIDWVVPPALRDQPRVLVAVVVLDPADPAFASFDPLGRSLAELEAAMADRKIAVGIAQERSVFEPTTLLAGGRIYPFLPTSILVQLPEASAAWWDTSTGPAPHPEDAAQSRGRHGEYLAVAGGSRVLNNQWNLPLVLGQLSTSVYVKADGTFGWQWSCDRTNTVVAYPSVVYGQWNSGMPFALAARRIRADFAIATSAEGVYDTAFDVWVYSAAQAPSQNDAREVMIWTDRKGMLFYPVGRIVDRVELGGVTWDVYVNPEQHASTPFTWTMIVFLPDRPVVSGPLDLSAFLDYLTQLEIVRTTDWVHSIELGTEVVVGAGATEVSGWGLTFSDPI